MVSIGGMQVLFFMLMSAAGQPTDLVSMLSPQDYFKAHGIEVTTDKLVELASKDPVSGQAQIAQLLALRTLGADANFKNSANYATQRKVIEDIAAGSKAQDKLGFAKEYARRILAQLDGDKAPALPAFGSREEGLAWFPESATIVGSLEQRAGSGGGAPGRFAQELFKQMPPEAKKEFYKVVDSLGNVQIRRVSYAHLGGGSGGGRSFVRLTGRFNPVWASQCVKEVGPEANPQKDQHDMSVIFVNRGNAAPVVALIGDHDLLIAAFDNEMNNTQRNVVLEQALAVRAKKQASAPSVALKASLAKVPVGAVGYFVGDLPDDLRRGAAQPFGAMPKSIIAYIEPAATGLDFVLKGAMEDEAQAKTFIQAASKLRMDGINELDKAPPLPIPGINLEDLKSMMNSMQLEAKGAEINVRMLISEEGMKTLPFFFVLRSAGGPVPPPPAKN